MMVLELVGGPLDGMIKEMGDEAVYDPSKFVYTTGPDTRPLVTPAGSGVYERHFFTNGEIVMEWEPSD